MRAYQDILRIPGALRFSSAGLLARSGGAMMGLGIVLMVSSLYGSYGLAGALVAANSVAWALGTAVLSNLVDRYGQRRVMYPATIVSATMLAVTVVFAVLQLPAWTLVAPVVISGATGGSPGALVRARWTNVTSDPHQLHAAFSLESTLDEVTFVVGPVLATALSTGIHPAAGLVAPVVLSLIGAQLFYSQRSTEPPVAPRPPAGTERPAALRQFILLTPGVAAVVAVNLLIGCVFGSIDVSVVAAATSWDVRSASGVVLAVFSAASGLAGLLYGTRHWRSSLPGRFVVGVLALFVATLGLFLANSVLILAAVGVLVGVTVAPTLINGNTLIGRLVLRERLTEGLAWMGTGIGIGAAVGSSVAGGVIDGFGHHEGFLVVIGFSTLAAVIAAASWRTLNRAERLVTEVDDADGQRETVFE
ncbi:MAG: MFS transporter [Propionicimonas sp.]|uniref:MFS transporter n=1 Tax=Propionicimonas sp. TaxID=1955623 RepID=UPI003D1136DC